MLWLVLMITLLFLIYKKWLNKRFDRDLELCLRVFKLEGVGIRQLPLYKDEEERPFIAILQEKMERKEVLKRWQPDRFS